MTRTNQVSSASPYAVEMEGLRVRFGRRDALAGVDLRLPLGSVFALVGPNGAGKTTLIKTLLNMVAPSAGAATVLGLPSTEVRGRALERIGYVSENQELPGWMTLEYFLAYLRPFYPGWDVGLERELAALFRLPAGRKIKQMSRGQQMKTALLAALAYRPSLLILDEPFSGLDPLARDECIAGLLDRAAAARDESPFTILLSSHDLAEIESFATHVGYLEEGRLVFAEEIGALRERFREITVVLGDPSAPAVQPASFPGSWIVSERGGSFLRFVHSRAATEPVREQVAALFPGATGVESEPMSLRSIFVALARSGRSELVSTAGGSRA